MDGESEGTYYTLNFMSYIWHATRYFPIVRKYIKKYPYLKDMILYKEPLHCIIKVEGSHVRMQGHYQTISPEDVGIGDGWNGVSIEPKVSNYEVGSMIHKFEKYK